MKIALVDDLASERETVRRLIFNYFNLHKKQYNILPDFYEFDSGEAFLETFQPGEFEIVFLDIYMKELNGVEVAQQLVTLDTNCSILFFTTSMDHMLDGYDVHAIGYILKPVVDHITSLYMAMDRVMEKHNFDHSSLCIVTPHGSHSVLFRNIVYLECSTRSLFLHIHSDKICICGKYADYSTTLLNDKRFLECYRNIIVNMDYIDVALESDFILKSGEKIPISRRKKAEVMEKYMAYFIEKRGD